MTHNPTGTSLGHGSQAARLEWLRGALGGMLGLGLLTALLPCGVLYVAFARAVTAGSAIGGGLALLAFWAGTVPLLAAVGLVSGHAFRWFGRLAPVLLAVAMTVTGGWLVFKGQRNLSSLAQAGTAAPAPCPHHR